MLPLRPASSVLCLVVVLALRQCSARLLQASSSSSSASSSSGDSIPSEWITGIATNYGGPSEGLDPGSPSWGTVEVSCCGCCAVFNDEVRIYRNLTTSSDSDPSIAALGLVSVRLLWNQMEIFWNAICWLATKVASLYIKNASDNTCAYACREAVAMVIFRKVLTPSGVSQPCRHRTVSTRLDQSKGVESALRSNVKTVEDSLR